MIRKIDTFNVDTKISNFGSTRDTSHNRKGRFFKWLPNTQGNRPYLD